MSTRDAIFILISDLNEDRLSPDLPRKKAIEYIRDKAMERWGQVKVMNFIQRTVPFVPLAADEMKAVAQATLRNLEGVLIEYSGGLWKGKLTWPSWVAGRVVQAAEAERQAENARGVVTWVEVEVKDRLLEAWEAEQTRAAMRPNQLPGQAGMVFSSFNLIVDNEGRVAVEPYGEGDPPPGGGGRRQPARAVVRSPWLLQL